MFASCLSLFALLVAPQGGVPQWEQKTVTIDDSQQFQTWEGFGAASAYVELLPDSLLGNDPDVVRDLAHLQTGSRRLRLRVPYEMEPSNDDNSPSNINYGGLDFTSWYPAQRTAYLAAKERGIDFVWASCGSPPAWMKKNAPSGGTLIKGGELDPTKYDEFAEFLAAYVEGLAHPHSSGISDAIVIDALSILNEPDYATVKYESTPTSKEEYAKLVRIVGQKFASLGLTTQILGPECSTVIKSTEYLQAIADNSHPTPAIDYLDGVTTHQYGQSAASGAVQWAALDAKSTLFGKSFGQTEVSYLGGTNDGILAGLGDVNGLGVSDWILTATNQSSCKHWSFFGYWWNPTSPTDPASTGEGLVRIDRGSMTYVVPKRLRVFQHYAAHIQPGAVRISGVGPRQIGVSAWLRPVGGRKEYAIVLSNKESASYLVSLSLPAAPSGTVTTYATSATLDHAAGVLYPTTATFNVELPKESIKTLIVPMGVPGTAGVEVQMTPAVMTGGTFGLKLRYHAGTTPPVVRVVLARLAPDGQLWYHLGATGLWTTTPGYHNGYLPLTNSTETIFTNEPASFFGEGRSSIYAALYDAATNLPVGDPSWMDVIADL